ncbi:MAG: ATP-dependent helicase [Candidatus Sumerlaeia bacterium]|nr:ATP-dependent helicase [Candidatus Sumerlaeia bacterium]
MVVAQPTDQQRVILDDTSRVRVVHAAPGSGKTWLVAELIRREIANWNRPGQGIAAISFTRVGGEEIRAALGHDLNHPHFVGTIDAFLFRYVIRPFLSKSFPEWKVPRLLPPTLAPAQWSRLGSVQGATPDERINAFGCPIWGWDGETDGPIIAHRPPWKPLQPLSQQLAKRVWDEKNRLWRKVGLISHSDAAFLSGVLLQGDEGRPLRQEITRRFPVIVVDELQDTSYFMGEVLKLLISEAPTRGVVVGDPDQAIYEFNGATPALFEGFKSAPDAVVLSLSQSRRCAAAVIQVATHLKQSGGGLVANPERQGRVYLVEYASLERDIAAIAKRVAMQRPLIAKVVVRSNTEVDELMGRRAKKDTPKLGCPALQHLHRAVNLFCQGRNADGLGSVMTALGLHLFDEEHISEESLKERGIDPDDWRRLGIDLLLHGSKCDRDGTAYDWQQRLGEALGEIIQSSTIGFSDELKAKKSKPQKRGDHSRASSDFLAAEGVVLALPVQTVHGVKGETHDVTILACKDPKKSDRCPSEAWWSDAPKDLEERRIAYVAVTRTRGDLIVCVSKKTLEALRSKRSEFVNCFEVMDVARFTAQYTFPPIPVDTATPVATESEVHP